MKHFFPGIFLVFVLGFGQVGRGADSPDGVKFFESRVRPILVEHCQGCHGESKQKGGLRLDTAEGLRRGGKNGPVLSAAGAPAGQAKLLVAVSYTDKDLQMPPEDEGKLSAEKVAVLAKWVEMGAPWGATMANDTGPLKGKKRTITDADRAFWSFQPPRAVAPPAVADAEWSANPVDRFIFAKLSAEGLTPAKRAEKVTLVRRAYFDLHGLPPTPAEVDAFVNDASPDAWEKLVDQLLASPRYGERMATHWLDLVRYAESDGYKQDAYRPNVWPYRDYVIRSFNENKPYDRFISEQLAGDEIAPSDPNVLIGTAFLRHGVYEYNQRDVKLHWQNILNEVTDVAADAFLGMSMGCAKCHDHKFDPILQADYYRLQAFFSPVLPQQDMTLASSEQKSAHAEANKVWLEKTAEIRGKLEALEGPYSKRSAAGTISKFPPEIQDAMNKPEAQRTPYEKQIAALAGRQVYDKTEAVEVKVSAADKPKQAELLKQLAAFDNIKPKPLPTALLATDVGPVGPPTVIPGDKSQTDIAPGYPVVLEKQGLAVPEISPTADSTGRRTALAKWLTQANNPLTTRVIVNRIWQYHFGRGLVGTSSDFGKLGDRPSHPELLDYLAVQLVQNHWQLKEIHRLIMTSAAYRQSSVRLMPQEARLKDPENRLLWKYPARRLDAEQIRDAMLSVSGELKLDVYGPASDSSSGRRSIYTKVIRNSREPLMEVFDVPDTFGSAADRNRTTTATQALLMINGDAPLKRAEMFAGRLRQMNLKTPAETVDAAWKLAYGRAATDKERAAGVAFLKQSPTPPLTGNSQLATGNSSSSIDEKPLVKSMPQMGSQAVYVRNARPDDMLRLESPANLPTGDFTIEAYVLLDSIYENASVRVIASKWDGKNDHSGWSFGVTSAASRYGPRNLILQLAGKGDTYEVVASDFRLELHRTYYVAASVKLTDTSTSGVTFYLKDISDMDAPLKSAGVKHTVIAGCVNQNALVIGGRDGKNANGWDGLLDEVRLSSKALSRDELLFNDGHPAKAVVCGHWVFEDLPGVLKDSAGVQKDLVKVGASSPAAIAQNKHDAALVDFCHVLLNSNGFLYMD